MTALTVFCAPPGACPAVFDTLLDWSAAGLLGPFAWMPPPSPDRNPLALTVAEGQVRVAHLADVMAEQVDLVRAVVVVPLGLPDQEPAPADERAFRDSLRPPVGTPVVWVRVLVPWDPQARPRGRDGWHTIMLSPEDVPSPRHEGHLWYSEPARIPLAAAAGLAGLGGLWPGVATSPVDDLAPLPGEQLRVARSFYRRVDTAGVEERLRAEVLDMSAGMPAPRTQGGLPAARYFPDPRDATQRMAVAWGRKHAGVLEGERVPTPQPTTGGVGGDQALRLFFGFLWAALRGTPERWARAVRTRSASAVASGLQNMVFGSQSAYTVVVDGMTPEGVPASWLEVGLASAQWARSLPVGRDEPQRGPANLREAWSDFVKGGLTLVDGAARVPEMEPLRVDASPGVVRRAADVAPGSAQDLHLSGVAASEIGRSALAPYDVLGAQDAAERLRAAEARGHASGDVARGAQELAAWQQQQATTYTVTVGRGILAATRRLRTEAAGHARRLAEFARDDTVDADSARLQRRLGLITRITAALALVAIAVLVTLGALEKLTWGKVAGWSAGVVVLWLIVTAVVFYRRQQDLFQALHRRQEAESQIGAIRANLRLTLEDLGRTAQAYQQYLVWAEVLGRFLADPLGRQALSPRLERPEVPTGRSVQRRLADAPDAAVAQVAAHLRSGLYTLGWAGFAWDASMKDVPGRLPPGAAAALPDPEMLYSEVPVADGPLVAWLGALRADGIGGGAGAALWRAAVARVTDPAAPYRGMLDLRVLTPAGPGEPADDFLRGASRGSAVAALVPEAFSASGRARRANLATFGDPAQVLLGLGAAVATVQMTDGLTSADLAGGTGVPRPSAADAAQADWRRAAAESEFDENENI